MVVPFVYTEEEMQKLRNQLSHWKVKFGEKSAQYRCDTKNLREKNKHQAFALKTMQEKNSQLEEENKKLEEKIRFLEECLDNKEKVNKSLREELQRYKDMWDMGEF